MYENCAEKTVSYAYTCSMYGYVIYSTVYIFIDILSAFYDFIRSCILPSRLQCLSFCPLAIRETCEMLCCIFMHTYTCICMYIYIYITCGEHVSRGSYAIYVCRYIRDSAKASLQIKHGFQLVFCASGIWS